MLCQVPEPPSARQPLHDLQDRHDGEGQRRGRAEVDTLRELRILFSVRNPSYVRHYESVLRALAERGHEVLLVTERPEKKGWPPSVLALAEECPLISLSRMPVVANDPWWELACRYRQARFYLRFLAPEYSGTPALLVRARSRAPRLACTTRRIARRGSTRTAPPGARPRSSRAATCTAAGFHPYIQELTPDVVVLTPLVVLKTSQLDLGRAATELGVRNVFAVASWDNLSSKGELTYRPQKVLVWNEVQAQEAIELHQVEPDRILVTGAQVFDEWFEKRPSTRRDEFCARVGLRADKPIVLYVCSALLEGSPPEPDFVMRWIRHLRSSAHPVLRECGILVRPHFKRGEQWDQRAFAALDNVVCWPPLGAVYRSMRPRKPTTSTRCITRRPWSD